MRLHDVKPYVCVWKKKTRFIFQPQHEHEYKQFNFYLLIYLLTYFWLTLNCYLTFPPVGYMREVTSQHKERAKQYKECRTIPCSWRSFTVLGPLWRKFDFRRSGTVFKQGQEALPLSVKEDPPLAGFRHKGGAYASKTCHCSATVSTHYKHKHTNPTASQWTLIHLFVSTQTSIRQFVVVHFVLNTS